MNKKIENIAAILLGIMMLIFGLNNFLNMSAQTTNNYISAKVEEIINLK